MTKGQVGEKLVHLALHISIVVAGLLVALPARAQAYSKPGGRAPPCCERDVTAGMAREWRERAGR